MLKWKLIQEIVQTVLPFAMNKFDNNKQIKQLKSEVERLRTRAFWFGCFGVIAGFILGFGISYFIF